jgi:hypothetical protein
MATLSWTLAVPAQVDSECTHPMSGHAVSEGFVPARMFAEPVHNSKGD